MRSIRIFLVRMTPASRPVALAAARRTFSEAEVIEVATVEEARQRGEAGQPELLVLADPDVNAAAEAIHSMDAGGLPRWAVVVLGGELGELAETVPQEEWSPALLARVFRAALLQHQLLCENLRLQGDLKTVARRVSHDLYTPVGCIYTSAHVLKIMLPAGELPSVAVMVRNIEDSSEEISQIIDRVSFLMRASADPLPPVRVEMTEVVEAVRRQLAAEIHKAGATVTHAEAWPEVSGVSTWLHVIWWNLLRNAVKHGGPRPQVRLEWQAGADGHRFSVKDQGPGITPAAVPGLFRPFDQLHLLSAPGLGLSIVQRLVMLQGGRCGYERTPDGASHFYFTLPAAAIGQPERLAETRPATVVPAASPRAAAGPVSAMPRAETANREPRDREIAMAPAQRAG